jgi:hypothetical protein
MALQAIRTEMQKLSGLLYAAVDASAVRHKPAMIRSNARKFRDRFLDRFKISS